MSMKDILEFTNQCKLSIMQSNLKSVEMNENKLKAIAEVKSKTDDKRMLALIRLTNICGNKIKYYQLHLISDIVSN